MNPVYLLHLITGQDIIGEVTFDEASMSYHVALPVTPHVSVGPDGGVRVGLMPLHPYAATAEKLVIGSYHVIYQQPVGEQMEQAYRQFHSPLVLPPQQSLSSLLKG